MTPAGEEMLELNDLVNGAIDGRLSEQQGGRLQQLLTGSEAARRHYVMTMRLSAALRSIAGRSAVKPSAPPSFGFLGDIARWGENLPGMRMFVWALAGFVAMLVGLPTIVAILAVLGLVNQPAARLVATKNCRWSDAAAAIPCGSSLWPGQRIELAAGTARIDFRRGAVVTLLAPAAIEVQSDSAVRILAGALTARAETKRSHGFVVHTPAMTLVDLGTEFGVLFPLDGVEEVDVLCGRVRAELAPRRWSEVGDKSQAAPASAILLTANQAMRVDEKSRTVARQEVAWEQFASIDGREPFPLAGTGVDMDPGQPDPHWWITDVDRQADFTPRPALAVTNTGNSTAISRHEGQWISLKNLPIERVGCRMTFRTTFDLTGFDPATAMIDGQFIGDNFVVEVRLNGKTLPLKNLSGVEWQPCRIGEGFVAGKNTLEMVAVNGGEGGAPNPMGLCVQWKGVARRTAQSAGF